MLHAVSEMFAELHKAVKKPSKAVPQTRQKTPDAKHTVSPYVKNRAVALTR